MAALMQGERSSHYAEAHRADRRWQHEAMLDIPPSERERADDHGERQPELMDDGFAKEAARRREEPEKHCGRDAVHHTQTRNAHRNPVEPGGRQGVLVHRRAYRSGIIQLQYNMRCSPGSCPSARRTQIGFRLMTSAIANSAGRADAREKPRALSNLLLFVALL